MSRWNRIRVANAVRVEEKQIGEADFSTALLTMDYEQLRSK